MMVLQASIMLEEMDKLQSIGYKNIATEISELGEGSMHQHFKH